MIYECSNTHDQHARMEGEHIALVQCSQPLIHGFHGWLVVRFLNGADKPTDPEAAWYHHKRKWFGPGEGRNKRERQKAGLAPAIAYACERWGQREFVRNRMGDYVEREVNEQYPIRRPER